MGAPRARYRRVLTPDQRACGALDIIDVGGSLTGWMREHGARVVA